ncbi:DUF4386 domain-containing protein [Dokdonella soli]|uniref:DUF4386 domain-containing protein n=1 Tax=Dokdonella soli TaxID=529810 RepID=A0ABN1IDV7_9GAMM
MTRTTNARIAGFTFLFYIAVGILGMVLFNPAAGVEGTAAKLAAIAQHATDVRIGICLNLLCCFSALVLAVTLYRITRDEDPDLAMLGLTFRVGEGVIGAIFVFADLGLLWLATAAGANAPDPAAAQALGAFFFNVGGWSPTIGATFFAVGSTIFSYLLLRGRMVPVPLAWLGVLASILLVALLPAQLAGFVTGPILNFMWLPILVFELALALWLLIKGVAMPRRRLDESSKEIQAPPVES